MLPQILHLQTNIPIKIIFHKYPVHLPSARTDNFIAHSAIWGYLPIQRQDKVWKKLTEEKLSGIGLSGYTKFDRAHL